MAKKRDSERTKSRPKTRASPPRAIRGSKSAIRRDVKDSGVSSHSRRGQRRASSSKLSAKDKKSPQTDISLQPKPSVSVKRSGDTKSRGVARRSKAKDTGKVAKKGAAKPVSPVRRRVKKQVRIEKRTTKVSKQQAEINRLKKELAEQAKRFRKARDEEILEAIKEDRREIARTLLIDYEEMTQAEKNARRVRLQDRWREALALIWEPGQGRATLELWALRNGFTKEELWAEYRRRNPRTMAA